MKVKEGSEQAALMPLVDRMLELGPLLIRRLKAQIPSELRATVDRELSGATHHQIEVIRTLAHRGPVTMGELAEANEVSMGAATQLVDRLLKLGMVERLADPRDGRVVRVALTAKAAELARRVQAARRQLLLSLVADLGPEDARTLVDLLARVAAWRHDDASIG